METPGTAGASRTGKDKDIPTPFSFSCLGLAPSPGERHKPSKHPFCLASWEGKGARIGAAVPHLLGITAEEEGIATKMMTKAATGGTGARGDHTTEDPGEMSTTVEEGGVATMVGGKGKGKGKGIGIGEGTSVGEMEPRRIYARSTTLHQLIRGPPAGATLSSLPMEPTGLGATLECMGLPTLVVRVEVSSGAGAAVEEETVHRGTNPGLSTASNFVQRRGRLEVSGIGRRLPRRRKSQRLSPW